MGVILSLQKAYEVGGGFQELGPRCKMEALIQFGPHGLFVGLPPTDEPTGGFEDLNRHWVFLQWLESPNELMEGFFLCSQPRERQRIEFYGRQVVCKFHAEAEFLAPDRPLPRICYIDESSEFDASSWEKAKPIIGR